MRVHVLPDDEALRRHLEDPPVTTLTDQRVAVGQALGAGDVRAEEVEQRLVAILPYDRAGARAALDHARIRRRVIAAVLAVVEDEAIVARQRAQARLLRLRAGTELARA